MDNVLREMETDVQRLVDELEATLDRRERRLLHQLRLAAEALGAVRARTPSPIPQRAAARPPECPDDPSTRAAADPSGKPLLRARRRD